jgi:hypothetical protein
MDDGLTLLGSCVLDDSSHVGLCMTCQMLFFVARDVNCEMLLISSGSVTCEVSLFLLAGTLTWTTRRWRGSASHWLLASSRYTQYWGTLHVTTDQ